MSEPLYALFTTPVAKVLEEARIVGAMEQTVSILSESTKLDNKTLQRTLARLVDLGEVEKTHPDRPGPGVKVQH